MSQHIHPHHRLGADQFQRLHHLGGSFLLLFEMGGLEVAPVGFFVGVDFEDVDLTWVFIGLHREEGQHAGLHFHRGLPNFLGVSQIRFQILRYHLDFGEADDAHAEKRVQKYGKKRKICSFPDEKSVSKLQLDTSCREALERLMNQPCTTRW